MRNNYPKVFVGRVKNVRVESVSTAGRPVDPLTEPTVAGKPPAQLGPTQKISFYSMEVVQSLSEEAPVAGSEVTFAVSGAEEVGSDGIVRRFVASGDDLLSVGGEYLLFATEEPSRPGVLVAAPWGKFVVDDGGLSPLIPNWSRLGFIQELEGLHPREVARRILIVDAGAPSE